MNIGDPALQNLVSEYNNKLAEQQKYRIVDEIKNMTNIDILNPKGLVEYISMFMHVSFLRKEDRKNIGTMKPEDRTGKFYLDVSERGNIMWQEEGLGVSQAKTLKEFHRSIGTGTVKETLINKLNGRTMSIKLSKLKDNIFKFFRIENSFDRDNDNRKI